MEGDEIVIEILQAIATVFYEAFCCRIFLDTFLQRRFSFKMENIFSVIFLTVAFFISAIFTQENSAYIMRCLGIVTGIFVFSMIFFSGKWQKKLFLSGAFYALLCCVDFFFYIILEKISYENIIVSIVLTLLSKTVLFVLVLLIERFWNRGKKIYLSETAWLLMICFPILSMMIMLVMMFSLVGRNSLMGYLIVSICIMVINVFMFLWLRYLSEKDRRWNQIRILQERNEEKMRLYNEISANFEEQKRILHDYRNQIGCIQGLLKKQEYEEAEKYAEKLTDLVPDYMQKINVNHPILNVVLNQKYQLAKQKNILFLFCANDLSDLWIEEQDAVSLLSNLLDNAIEACERLESERRIWVKLVREKCQLVISVRNTACEPVNMNENEMTTTKEDKENHGIGLKNIQMILNKYQGMGRVQYKEGCFSYTAVIPDVNK